MAKVEKFDKENEEKAKVAKPQQRPQQNVEYVKLIRIASKDIPGNMKIYPGLTRIKGVSWAISNAVCIALRLDKNKKIINLAESEIKNIEDFLKNPKLPAFIVNRRNDFESGMDKHLTGTNLDLQKDFDIKRLKKIRSYRGLRHVSGQPLRGQRTRAHFRLNRRKSTGVKKKVKA
jgi:small subunit ribosomal protein S13